MHGGVALDSVIVNVLYDVISRTFQYK